jgi:hypothetical protein
VESPKEEFPAPRTARLSSNGWELPKDGKRVVRNVEAMGKAAGWLVLGVGLILESEGGRIAKVERPRKNSEEDGAVVFDSKGKGRARSHNNLGDALSNGSAASMAAAAENGPDDGRDTLTAVKRVKLLVSA